MRKFDTSDPLRRAKRPVRRPMGSAPVRPVPLSSGGAPVVPTQRIPPVPAGVNGVPAPSSSGASAAAANSGEWKEFPLRACSSHELHDSRFHMVKFQSKQPVDIQAQFTPPIRFQRKDPKNIQLMVGEEEEEKEKKANPFFRKRKTHQVMGGTDESGEAARKLRQEEHYPWVMEDFDGNNAWVSSYEAAQSDTYCVFVFDQNGFKMIPVEKWYRMNSRNKFASLSLDQAEERMQKKGAQHSRWIMDRLQQESGVSGRGADRVRKLRTVEGSEERAINGEEMDYDEEFADDEEAPLIEGPEEELKDVQERIKKEQLQATHPLAATEDDDLFGDNEIDKQGKKLRKYLRSHEKNAQYDDSDDENPYASESDDSEPEVKEEPKHEEKAPQLVVFRRKAIKGLPHGMAVVQLPGALLKKFPKGEWNPHVRRRTESPATASAVAAAAPAAQAPASVSSSAASSSSSPYARANTSDPTLLTCEDVRAAFKSPRLAIPDLIKSLREKLSQNRQNKDRLKVILREVAHLQEGNMLLLI